MDQALLQQLVEAGLAPARRDVLDRRRRRAEMLMQATTPEGMRVGGTYQAASPLEHLASAFSRVMGGRMASGLDDKADALVNQQGAARAAYGQAAAGVTSPDTTDLYSTDPVKAKSALDALTAAATQRRDLGAAGALSGDPVIGATAGQYAADARSYDAGALGVGQHRADLGQRQSEAQARQALAEAAAARAAAAAAETARHNRASEETARSALNQDAYTATPDPITGRIVVLNRKQGTTSVVAPGATGAGLPPPKPKDMEDDVQKLGKDVEPVAQMKADLATLDAAVAKGSVPGFGPVQGRIPSMLASDEAISARQAARRLTAAIIQARSGTAASDAEVDRLLTAYGLGPTATDEQIKQGVAALRQQAVDTVGRMESKYHPQVVQTYHDRGGVSATDFKPQMSADDQAAKAWADANPNDPRAAAILQALKAKGL